MTPTQRDLYAAAVGGILAPHDYPRATVRDILKRMNLSEADADEVIDHTIARGWAVEVQRFGEPYLCSAPHTPDAA